MTKESPRTLKLNPVSWKIRNRARCGADFIQQLQPVFAHLWIVVVDFYLVEKRVDSRTQHCHEAHGGGKVLVITATLVSTFARSIASASAFSSVRL